MGRRVTGWNKAWVGMVTVVALALTACGQQAPAAATSAPTAASKPAGAAQASPSAVQPAAQAAASPRPSPSAAAKPAASPSVVVSASPAASGPLVKVRAAYAQASSVQGVLYAAKALGFLERNGLDMDLAMVTGPNQVPALLNNELQFGALGANEVGNAAAGGADLAIIATCSDLPIFSLYADPKQAKSMDDLAGKTIGVTAAGSATDAAAHLFLKQFNLEDKVRIVPAGGTIPSILAAMTQGTIAGGIISPPTTQVAESQGFVELTSGTKLGVPQNHSAIAVSRKFAQQQPDVVRRFAKAYDEAWKFAADPANEAAMVKVLEEYTRTDENLATVGYDAIFPVWQNTPVPRENPQAVANVLSLSDNPAARSLDPAKIIDNSFIEAAAGS